MAVEADWRRLTDTATKRLADAERLADELDAGSRWDLEFLRLRTDYARLLLDGGGFSPGPDGKDPDALADLRRRVEELADSAPDRVRHGWARMYHGLALDNLLGERAAAPEHYAAALAAGEGADDLLAREALRHLGDHDHDDGHHARAHARWARATELGARAGAVSGTLAQQLLLAVLARDTGDEAGARALATEVARWAAALGAVAVERQANDFLAGADPTAAPQE